MSKFFKAPQEADRERALRQQAKEPEADATGAAPNPPAPQRREPPFLVDDIRKMAGRPFQLVDQFIEEARRLATEEQVAPTAAMEKFKQLQQRLVQETEDLLKTFRLKVSQREQELQALLHPVREDLATQALKAVRELHRVIDHFAQKEKLTRRWLDQSASTLLAEYQKALRRGDVDKIEIFEAEAEGFLARKGDPQALSDFVALRAQSLGSRLTPAQKEAKAALEELSRIKEEAKISLCFLAFTFPAYGGLVPLGALWRKEGRQSLDQVDQRGISVVLHKDEHTSLPMTLLEFSKSGLKVQASEKFPAGTILTLSLEFPGVTERPISFKGKVRWCKEEPNQQGRYALGLQLVEGPEGRWPELFPRILSQVSEINDLFSSLGG
ncbi:MAG: PilZ domain-containing protein [candidate division NC10 bacterium]|nr:PilZ domain-containing protein [candidate division NC10 bacterium]